MEIKIKKLYNDTILPKKAHITDACFDIYAYTPDKDIVIYPHTTSKLGAGFATEIPQGYYCEVHTRSSLGIKMNLRLPNCTGIIDSDYRGEWIIALYNDSDEPRVIHHGDRISQFAIHKVLDCNLVEVEELNESDRGIGGLGSTGK